MKKKLIKVTEPCSMCPGTHSDDLGFICDDCQGEGVITFRRYIPVENYYPEHSLFSDLSEGRVAQK
jgi:hypothetical protein